MPDPYRVEQVARGVWSIRVPRPTGGDAAVAYALECTDGYLLVDAGWNAPDGLDSLSAALEPIGIDVADIRGVALTHLHLDHCGLAEEVRRVSGAWVAAHPAEVASARYRHGASSPFVEDVEQWLEAVGVPPDKALPLLEARDATNAAGPIFDVDVLLGDGDSLDAPSWSLVALHTPGHSPGHVCFHDSERGLLFGGDLVLEEHVPPISCYGLDEADDPISDFFASLERVERLDGVQVLPGHGAPFADAASVAARLREHHEKRMDWLAGHLAGGAATVWEAALAAPWSRAWPELRPLLQLLALGKINAHLVALVRRGRVRRIDDVPFRFALARSGSPAAKTPVR
jgi:glyoxylase-like metal-dependent hydrolase (beta-lactamase superfamily II)